MTPVESVYVHAPFCARRCFYCDFAVKVRRTGDAEGWAAATARELAILEAEGMVLAPRLRTLYVGGGTPSLLGAGAMGLLADVLGRNRLTHPGLEWTAEANPESLTPEVAEGWSRAGVNRISLGVQSFQEPVLRWMGRLHGPEGAREAVARARRAGFANLSVDLIFGLPETLERDWRGDLEAAAALEVPHVSLYGLTAEPGTPLGRRVAEGRVAMPPDDRYADEYLEAHERLTARGFRHYEVSNFALPGHESLHNRRYWDGTPYLGLGNGSHSFFPPERRWNLRAWDAYLQALDRGTLPLDGSEEVLGDAAVLERLWLGLRTDAGVPEDWLAGERARAVADRWVREGLAGLERERLRLTPRGWLLLDRLTVEMWDASTPIPADA